MSRPLDFHRVVSGLYQGGYVDPAAAYAEFSCIVLCARELQPEISRFRGRILRPAFDDTRTPSETDVRRANAAAVLVAREVKSGGRVLVTCAAGRNRSGLVVGLALCYTSMLSPDDIVQLIRAARGANALSNETFVKMIGACHRALRAGASELRP